MESILLESITTKFGLCLAVLLVDDFTGRPAIGKIEVTIGEKKGTMSRGGYFLFRDLPAGRYKPTIESQYYFDYQGDEDITIVSPSDALSSAELVRNISLQPKPCYPFPEGVTLIRGTVFEKGSDPTVTIPGAKVWIGGQFGGKDIKNMTTEKGEFVLYFNKLKDKDISIDKKKNKRYLKSEGLDFPPQIRIYALAEYYQATENWFLVVEEGKTTSLKLGLKKRGG